MCSPGHAFLCACSSSVAHSLHPSDPKPSRHKTARDLDHCMYAWRGSTHAAGRWRRVCKTKAQVADMSATQKLDASWLQKCPGMLQHLKLLLSCQADAKAMATPADSKQEVKPVKARLHALRESAACDCVCKPLPRQSHGRAVRSQIIRSSIIMRCLDWRSRSLGSTALTAAASRWSSPS